MDSCDFRQAGFLQNAKSLNAIIYVHLQPCQTIYYRLISEIQCNSALWQDRYLLNTDTRLSRKVYVCPDAMVLYFLSSLVNTDTLFSDPTDNAVMISLCRHWLYARVYYRRFDNCKLEMLESKAFNASMRFTAVA